jgi:hypothetical protein
MTTAALRYVVTFALASALCLMVAIASLEHIRTGAEGRSLMSQYCVPPDDGSDAHRFYCRHGRG